MNTAIGTTCLSPRIRFKGFGGAWEARPLGDDGKTISGVGFPESDQGGVVGTPFFKVSDMSNPGNESLMVRANNYVSEEQIRKHSWRPVEHLPAILFAKVGAAALLNRKRLVENRFLMDNNMMAYCLNDGCNADFFKVLFESIDLSSFVQVGALPSINGKDVESKVARFPSLPEQRRIAEFFRNLDETIAATDARLEKLRQSKKSLLEKMFPRPGASVPEIRFKGFEGEWESKKLNEIADPISEKNVRLETREAFTNSAELGIISQRDFFDFDVAKRLAGYLLIRPDDFVYNPRISILAPFGPINRNELGRVGAMSPLYFAFRSHGIVIDYLQVFFKTSCWHSFMRFNGDSGARSDRFSIRNDLFMQMPILAPKSRDEQQRIGAFFRELDKLIESVQKKAAKLRQVKSALLEEMFV